MLELVAIGYKDYDALAEEFDVSVRTVRAYVGRLFDKRAGADRTKASYRAAGTVLLSSERKLLSRRGVYIRVLAVLLVGVCVLAGCGTEEVQTSSDVREEATGDNDQGAAQPVGQRDGEGEAESTVEATSVRLRCSDEERAGREEIRIGDFEPPESVPEYETLEEKPDERDGAEATRLLVDTRARSEEEYTLITRDVKVAYSELDAVGIEFTDTTDGFSYNGSAVIFNTPCGSDYIGYIFRPPNNEGYEVIVPKD